MSQNIRRCLKEVSDTFMHFCQFQAEKCDAKCILLATGTGLTTLKVVKLIFSKQPL